MRPYTWDEFDADARELVRQIREVEPFEAIYAIPRGGLVLGVYLSHTLNLPLICAVDVAPESLLRRTLVVDDHHNRGGALRILASCVLIHHRITVLPPSSPASPIGRFPWELTVRCADRYC
jgi:adenine/guanine phosphoribosyltransferase-like PRPP-binding protein